MKRPFLFFIFGSMKYWLSVLFITCGLISYAQTTFNGELQIYPTGLIPGLRIENQISDKTKIHLRVGLNLFDHRDLGEQDEERGWGYGFTLGFSRQLKTSRFALGFRNDFWFNNVDWTDNTSSPSPISGETDIAVLQPTVELTYSLNTEKLSIRPSIAFGSEWNVRTEGRPTGEGPIILIGIIVGGL